MTVDQRVPTNPEPTLATTPRMVRASRSPNEAANGVARLSEHGTSQSIILLMVLKLNARRAPGFMRK